MFKNLKELGYGIVSVSTIIKPIEYKGDISILINPHKIQILILLENNKEMTISEIQRELKISYKETYRHIKEMINMKILLREKKNKEKHSPVYIRLNKKNN